MLRTAMTAAGGVLVGVGLTAVLLWLTGVVLDRSTAPAVHRIEHAVVYTTVVLGSGLGGVCGALIGLAGVVERRLRDRSGSAP